MTEVDEPDVNWLDSTCEELIKELLDDSSPFIISPKVVHEAVTDKFHSSAYYGPTISDIERALPTSFQRRSKEPQNLYFSTTVLQPHKRTDKKENKYTITARSYENEVADDGFKWRKYGQKSIKNSPNPRSYYRCTSPQCNAKKQVERSIEDPDKLIITYEGIHLHYAYSNFVLPRAYNQCARSPYSTKARLT